MEVKLILETCPRCHSANLEAYDTIPQWGGNRIYVPGLDRSCPRCGYDPAMEDGATVTAVTSSQSVSPAPSSEQPAQSDKATPGGGKGV